MTIYLIFFALLALMAVLFYYPKSNKKQFNKLFTLIIFVSLLLIIGLRHPSMGNDLRYGASNGYLGSFDIIADMSWTDVFSLDSFLNYETGFIFYCKIVSSIWNNQQFFLFITAFFSIFPIFLVIYKKSENAIMSSVIYMGIPAFLMIYSGLRQSLAIGICFFAMLLLMKEKKKFYIYALFVLIVLFATTFHSSAIVFLVALPLYFIKLNKVARWISVGVLPVIYVLRHSLFNFINSFLQKSDSTYNQGAITLFLVFCAIYVFCILLCKESSREYNVLMNIFYLACVAQAFSGVHDLAMRIGYYFMLAIILLLPYVVSKMKISNNALISNIGINAAFCLYALYSIYATTWPMAYPYYFFWETII